MPKDPQVIVQYLREAARWHVTGNKFNRFALYSQYPFFIPGFLQTSNFSSVFARKVNVEFIEQIFRGEQKLMRDLEDVITELAADDIVCKELYSTKSMHSQSRITEWARKLFPVGILKSKAAQVFEDFLTNEFQKKLDKQHLSTTRNWQSSLFGIKILKIKMIFDLLNQMRPKEKTGVFLFYKTRKDLLNRQDAILIHLLATCRQHANALVEEFYSINNHNDEKINLFMWAQGQPLFNEHLGFHRGTHETSSVQQLKKRLATLRDASATTSSQIQFEENDFTLITPSSMPPLISSEFTPGQEDTMEASTSSQSQQSSAFEASAPPLLQEEIADALLDKYAASAPPLTLGDLSDDPDDNAEVERQEASATTTDDPASSEASGDSSGESQEAAEEEPLDFGMPDATTLPDPQPAPAENPLNMPSVPTAPAPGQAAPQKLKPAAEEAKPQSRSPAQ